MLITTGDLEVIDSGLIESNELNPIEFKFNDNNREMILRVIIIFKPQEETEIRTEIVSNNEMNIIFQNPHTIDDIGTTNQ